MINHPSEARAERLERVIKELRQRFGEWIIYRLQDARAHIGASAISTGSLGLDQATGIGGVPRARLTEFSGQPTSGKSAVAFHVLASAQRQQGFVALIDASHTADFAQIERSGVNLADLLLAVPESAQEAFDISSLLVASEGLDALLLSTANSLVTGPMGDPRAFGGGLRRLIAELAHAPTALIVLVQNEAAGRPSGGNAARALAHAASLRVAFTPLSLVTHTSGEILGIRTRAEAIKNKLAPPYGTAEFEVWRDRGVHIAAELFSLGLQHGVIRQHQHSLGYLFDNTWLGHGRRSAISTLEADPGIAAAVRSALLHVMPSPAQSVLSPDQVPRL